MSRDNRRSEYDEDSVPRRKPRPDEEDDLDFEDYDDEDLDDEDFEDEDYDDEDDDR